MITEKDMAAYIKKLKSASFENEHGEKFTIHTDGNTVYMSGDEIDMMVDPKYTVKGYLPLFNSKFNIWSRGELYKLGVALQKISEEESNG